jgi:hypothetical protein
MHVGLLTHRAKGVVTRVVVIPGPFKMRHCLGFGASAPSQPSALCTSYPPRRLHNTQSMKDCTALLLESLVNAPGNVVSARQCKHRWAGAYTRPLFCSTKAVLVSEPYQLKVPNVSHKKCIELRSRRV